MKGLPRLGAAVTVLALAALTGACSSGSPAVGGNATATVGQPTTGTSPGSGGTGGGAPGAPAVTGAAAPSSSPLATEVNPPGDIPDNQAYVTYAVPGSSVGLKVPEGWSRSASGGATTFTSKLNSIRVAVSPVSTAPTTAAVRARAGRTVATTVANYVPGKVSTVRRAGQAVVLFTYLGDSAPDPVTSRVVRDAVEQYTYWKAGTELILTLAGPNNADNVDPWRAVTDSVRFG